MATTRLTSLPEAQLERINHLASRLVLALLVVALAHTAARITWELVAPAPKEPLALPGPTPPSTATATRPADHAARIVNAHLFGVVQSRPQIVQPASVPETRLNLTLRGVLAAPGEQAIALIASGSGPESVYQVGDRLPGGAVLKEVLPDRVVLERNGQLETLKLPRAKTTGFNTNEPAPRASAGAGAPARSFSALRERAASRALARLKQTALRNPQALARMIRATPVEENGQLVGYRVAPGTNRSLFTQLGLRPGDIVTQINGITLSDPNDTLSVLQVLNDADRISITVRRNGTETTLTHAIGETGGG